MPTITERQKIMAEKLASGLMLKLHTDVLEKGVTFDRAEDEPGVYKFAHGVAAHKIEIRGRVEIKFL